MFRSIARVVVPVGMVSVSVLASLANAQISPNLPNPIMAPNPLTATISIFRSNMQDKIMKAADEMPESKYSYRPTKDVRSFAEILNHVADISYTLCSNVKGEATPATATATGSKTKIMARLKGAFDYCDGVYSGFTDAHLNDPADFFGTKTNKMFVLTQVANHDALHYGNLATYSAPQWPRAVRGLVLMAQRRPRPTKRFRIGRSCASVGIRPRAGWLFLCVARSSPKPLNTRMVCSGVVSYRYRVRPTA